ncbi:GWT1-domain-containing protein [Rhizopus microsporus]|uniref:GPI-anchored wall transfer protein n=2 Tax=Rhizopus TaxID=4842 RepID=A0A1X0S7W5_RHIZD|nr:GWT1-domain-containing protein [Rhizopus microsporus]
MVEISEEEYKLAKEAHVSNCTGGTIHEIFDIGIIILISHHVWNVLVKSKRINPDSFLAQFMIYVVPLLSLQTWASSYGYIAIFVGKSFIFYQILKSLKQEPLKKMDTKSTYRPFLTIYRAGLMLMTCMDILAVDFQFYPRRFAKVETFGISLMDLGVGSFVFSSGVVAARSYLNHRQPGLLKALRSGLAILVLGFARLFLTKSVNYQEHVSEYGLHWNFFFTLGFLPPMVTLLGFLRKRMPFVVPAFAIIIGYQFALNQGLQDWILNAPRTDVISANKEGICSFMGYLSIFMFGLQCGEILFQKSLSEPAKQKKMLIIGYISSLAFVGSSYLWTWLQPEFGISRRMANLPYVLCVASLNIYLITTSMAIELLVIDQKQPGLLEAINANGLFTFLLANVLTGLVNLSMRTLYMNTINSFIVNLCYMLIVTLIPWFMWTRLHIQLKI